MYKLVAFDMDGTLLKSDKTISPNTSASLNEASNRGQSICLCTGRGLAELKDYEGELDFCDYGILLSECLIYDFKNNQPLEVHSFDTDVFTQMMDIVKKEDVMLYLLDSSHSIASQKDIKNMSYYNMAIYQSMFESRAEAVEDIYGVKVVSVNTMVYAGKVKSRFTKSGIITGRLNAYKKAVVTLSEGENIDFYSNI